MICCILVVFVVVVAFVVVVLVLVALKLKFNMIEVQGIVKVKINEYIQDGQKFVLGDIMVKFGVMVMFKNKSMDGALYLFLLLKKLVLLKMVIVVIICLVCGLLLVVYQVDLNMGEVKVLVVDVGQLGFDMMGDVKIVGDLVYLLFKGKVMFKVIVKKGFKFIYFCVVHVWMQGIIIVK